MANECTLLWETQVPIPFTVSGATSTYEKGTVMKLFDPMTAGGALASNEPFAGILAEEKIDDGNLEIPVYRGGIFRGTASGAILINAPLVTASLGTNLLEEAGSNDENVVGISLEAAGDGETFAFELRPTAMQLA